MTVEIDHATLRSRSEVLHRYGTAEQYVAGFEGPGGLFVVYEPHDRAYVFTPRRHDGDREWLLRMANGQVQSHWPNRTVATKIARMVADGDLVPDEPSPNRLIIPEYEVARVELESWPVLESFLRSEDDFCGFFHGAGGAYLVCLASMVGEYDHQRYLILTMRDEQREIVWLYLEPKTTSWSSEEQALAIAHALANQTIEATQTERGDWVVDEFEADKVDE